MMKTYFTSFVRSNKVKIAMLVLSLSLYFALIAVALTLERSIPELASLPLKSIGVQTIVQKTGKIPEKMVGIIFPHSNAPISDSEMTALNGLAFVEAYDSGIYFWVFDKTSFKAVFGVNRESPIIGDILKNNVVQGNIDISRNTILVTGDFAQKNSLSPGAPVIIAGKSYVVRGVLKPNMSGNIIPADIYMDVQEAAASARNSEEMQKLYTFGKEPFSTVVLLKTDPAWSGDKEKTIKAIDKDLLVFSEKTFTKDILEQLKIISASGRAMFMVLGMVLLVAFCVMIIFNLKTREQEIAILRMLGWKLSDLKRQFIGETLVLLLVALVVGNLLAFAGLGILGTRAISMELPWDISAKPHFLPQENSIERIVTTNIPIHLDWFLIMLLSLAFIGIFLIINYALFYRLKDIKPFDMQGG
jgi:ABC-type antimicrobial peptide transport system permease subunit